MSYKLGSLFDGSGGFPLSGALCGVEPGWAAEVEPYPIAVTRSRFPNMKHLGDISKVNGGEIEPVDIITFGSPCQDLSVAGKRAGLKHAANGDEETTRSGLFMEAVRIIKEMREATNGKYPRFALWENVPGAFSSNKGEDFRIVCEELIKIVEPSASMPSVPKGGWAYADSYVGDGWSLAYRVFDAQYWGVPQRRRRIHLVADFNGERAREVLFEREGVRGYFATGRTPWQATPVDAQGGAPADDREGEGFDGAAGGRQLDAVGVDIYNFAETGEQAATLTTQGGGTASAPSVMVPVPYTLKIRGGVEVDSAGKAAGKGALIQKDMSATLGTSQDQYLFQPVGAFCPETGGNDPSRSVAYQEELSPTLRAGATPAVVEPKQVICMATQQGGAEIRTDDKAPTLTAAAGMSGNNQPVIAFDRAAFNQGQNAQYDFEVTDSGVNSTLVARGPSGVAYGFDPQAARDVGKYVHEETANTLVNGTNPGWHNGVAYSVDEKMGQTYTWEEQANTLAARDYKQPQAVAFQTYQDVTGPLMANSHPGSYTGQDAFSDMLIAGPETPVRYIVRRLTPTECARLQGFADWWGIVEQKDSLTDEEYQFWLEVRNTHAAINGRPVKDYTKAQMLTWYNKLWTDSAEYKMWGNGIALPPALYCLQGIVDALNKPEEDDDSWLM